MNNTLLPTIDALLRGGAVALVVLLAGALVRDHGRLAAARLGALFALGTGAYALCGVPGLAAAFGVAAVPLLALSAGNNVVFWLLAAALFDDGFELRRWHLGLWLAMVAVGLAECFIRSPALGIGLTLTSLAFAGLAVAQTLATWRTDLVEGRRRLRLFIVIASSIYIALTAIFQLMGAGRAPASGANLAGGLGLLAIAGTVAWTLLRISSRQSLFAILPDRVAAAQAAPTADPRPEPVDPGQVAALERAMTVERAYREEGLTIGALAQRLGLPEYRLRRLINQGLGYRNFNGFLNYYRIAEARTALADPSQAGVPVLTIALDAGFSSLGPFNRAFKAETGLTPSDYRRQAAGIDRPIPESAGVFSNPARGISPVP